MSKHSKFLVPLMIVLTLLVGLINVHPAEGKMQLRVEPEAAWQESVSLCKNRVNVPESEMYWLYVPASAAELHTEISYSFLAGQLILNGVVDASTCPAGGLGAQGYANACGLSVAKPTMIEMQNAYDQAIMDAWNMVGVPPVVLKQLIRYESQFWPGWFDGVHYGLGQLTYYGAHTALTWRATLRQKVCTITGSCSGPVNNSEVYTLLSLMDATCPNCENKIDMGKAQNSIYYLAEALMAHCYQSVQIVHNASDASASTVVDYATIWRLTLMDYNVGPNCVYNAVSQAYAVKNGTLSWNDITSNVTDDYCERGVLYSNQITEKFYDFPPK